MMIRFQRLTASVLAVAALATAPLLGQFPQADKAHLDVEPNAVTAAAGGTTEITARVVIDHGWHVNSHQPTFDYLIPTELDLELPTGWPAPRVDYPPGAMRTFAFENEPLSVYEGKVALPVHLDIPLDAPASVPVKAILAYQACNDRQCLPPTHATAEVTLTVSGTGAGSAPPTTGSPAVETQVAPATTGAPTAAPPAPAAAKPPIRLLGILLLALLGGLILNVMPCVLPVLALKALGLVRAAGQDRREVSRGALATSAGILVSFWALAGAAIVARTAGAAVGWGIQFQQPIFVAALTVVVVLFTLNLWGLFEITLPFRLAQLADAGPREGLGGHFVSGLFATLMATPCSAPFLGTAVGFALGEPAVQVLAVFTALGLGMSAPYLLLAVAPGSARLLPRPGPWMETLKGAMGFLLAAAAVWLLYVLSAQIAAVHLAFFEVSLLALAMLVWLRHRSRRSVARRLTAVGVLAAIALALALASAASAPREPAVSTATGAAAQGIAWTPFDREKARELSASGRLVFVDVTADWCFTCKVNERLVLDHPAVADAFRSHRVIAMRADWTNRSDGIARFLSDHGRYGIPFYLLYRPGREPHVFGELITRDEILSELAASDGGATAPSPASR